MIDSWQLILTEEFVFGGGAITINDNAAATPYPQTVNVANLPHRVKDVKLVVGNFSHTCPADVDMLLVAPNGRAYLMMSDVGGCTPGVSNVTFTLSDQGQSLLPMSAPILALGQYQPTNVGTTDTFPGPAPAGPYRSGVPVGADAFDTAFDGVDPNGTWSLYVVDDAAGDTGSIGFWNLIITAAAEFSNNSAVTITDSSPATPYPVPVDVANVAGTLKRASLRVNNLTHTFPDDINIMLASPSSRAFIAQSDAGSTFDASNTTYWLDDFGGLQIPDAAAYVDGSVYQPADYSTFEPFPAGAPATFGDAAPTGSATFTSVFGGDQPNGTWNVFLFDDAGGDFGTVNSGFTVGIETMYEFLFRDGYDD